MQCPGKASLANSRCFVGNWHSLISELKEFYFILICFMCDDPREAAKFFGVFRVKLSICR